MKNNEIMISARFEFGEKNKSQELSFLVLKDISLKAFMEALYYGLKKSRKYEKCFELLEQYIKTHKEIQVLYTDKGSYNIVDFTADLERDGNKIKIYNAGLDQLGFVTSSCILFTKADEIKPLCLFHKEENSYILKEKDTLEYNISTRRLNVIEPSIIDIIPPNDMPQKDKASFLDVIIPTVLSTGGMLGARFLIMKLAPSASSMGNTMILMSGAMGVVSLVTSLYSFMKKKPTIKRMSRNGKVIMRIILGGLLGQFRSGRKAI